MCGIAGIVSNSEKVSRESLQTMISKLRHRGPDSMGIWIDDSGCVGMAHSRLSIIDLSDKAAQPMHYLEKYSITFNGEIYNYLELKKELVFKGYKFKSDSDTEVLLALYDCDKEKCLDKLDGMFAFAIWDKTNRILFCARDRFGEKPFFFSTSTNKFSFASEIKALFPFIGKKKTNERLIYNYLLFGLTSDPNFPTETTFAEVNQLPPASFLLLKENKIKIEKYWSINLEDTISISEEKAIEKFKELFFLSVSRRLRSDVPIGSSLSGGIDSSSIVLAINKIKGIGQIQKTFSARFKDFSKDEGKFMDLVLEKSKNIQPHFIFPTAESTYQNLRTIMYHQEMPFGTASVSVQYEVMKLAKTNGITVLLDGQGADETLAGYDTFFLSYIKQLFKQNRANYKSLIANFKSLYNYTSPAIDYDFIQSTYAYSIHRKFGKLSRIYKNPSSPFFQGIEPEIVKRYRNNENPINRPPNLKEHLHYATVRQGLQTLLHYADRNSMAHSVEVRLPFLNHNLVEFIFKLPDNFKINKGWTKNILRKSMEDILPMEIAWRRDKIGFEPPQGEWMQNTNFKELISEAISTLLRKNYISKANPGMEWSYIMLYLLEETFES